jgi:uncharacterized protein (DUF1778 family)
MYTKKATRKTLRGTGTRSTKKTGYVLQSVRMPVAENNLVRKAADIKGVSINGWAAVTLRDAAQGVIDEYAASREGR